MKVTRWHLLIVVLFLLFGVVTVVSVFPYTLRLGSDLAHKGDAPSPTNHIINLTAPPSSYLAKLAKQDGPTRRVVKRAALGERTAVIATTLKQSDLLDVIAAPDQYHETTSYVVQAGDNLYRIARHFGTTVSAIIELNNITNPNLIYPGQYLKIPAYINPTTTIYEPTGSQVYATQYVVQYGDTLYAIARYYNTTVAAIIQANNLPNSYNIRPGQVLVIPDGSYTHQPPAPTTPNTPTADQQDPPTITGDRACTRFNFLAGRDRYQGSRAGRYEMNEVTGKLLATWQAREGDVDSGWLSNLTTSFESVHIVVTFYPGDGSAAVNMQIVNPAGGTSYGWLTRNVCHAVEIQFP
jgi:LysM repeat protein